MSTARPPTPATPAAPPPPQRPPRWRALFRVLHRDLGYLFFGATIVYAVSGLAVNHRADWNPNYSVEKRTHAAPAELAARTPFTKDAALALLADAKVDARYKKHFAPDDRHIRIFVDNGAATLDRQTGALDIEVLRRRPVLATFNRLHLNPGRAWLWFADAFAASLLIIAVTGLFLLRGKNGITRRGGLLAALGIIIPCIIAWLSL
ncbi:hypothetical protein M2447_001932 [Ereboglobus sp. PH5-10]|uniref:PepSY-associated TM helix domain-containing protein n=1 Tax=Ereboglobus sp. PH5-10 TaxID=2940629 RepID=UPI00240581AE|nr:PepSY-associated TM helix domain-containing protein [Ereboglobus sp. PH5-10]MDF9827830.1 hypothetical protein [Ereboglobus sp. PH5-10]